MGRRAVDYHDHNEAGWMFHVDVDKPIDQAFIEQPRR